MKTSVVPWRTPEQFQKVYEYTYSDDIAKKRWAVEQMAVWETRCWPSLPFAVEATLLLIRSKIQDTLFEADKSLCHAREVEMMYSTAIIRFVNLILENDQNTQGRIRMSELAEKKNIPAWIIDVRHNATHGHSPTLPVLRMAYKTIMEYLEVTFWAPESERVSLVKKTFNDKSIIELLEQYRKVQYQSLRNKYVSRKVKQSQKKALIAVKKQIASYICKPHSRRKFLQVLVHPDNFVTKDDIELAKDDKEFFGDSVKDNDNVLPCQLKKLWNPLIQILHRYDCIPVFLELLLLSQENRRIGIFQKVVDYMVLHILDVTNPSDSKSREWAMFMRKGPLINLYRLLYCCMKGSSVYSRIVFDKVTPNLKLNSWLGELSAVLSIKQGLTVGRDTASTNRGQKRKFDITFTVGDLEEDIQAEMANRNPKMKKNHWSLAPIGMDFSTVPLGHVFNPVEKRRNEEIKHDVENKSKEENGTLTFTATEGSMPVEAPKLKNFIFQRPPAESFMIYRRRNK